MQTDSTITSKQFKLCGNLFPSTIGKFQCTLSHALLKFCNSHFKLSFLAFQFEAHTT